MYTINQYMNGKLNRSYSNSCIEEILYEKKLWDEIDNPNKEYDCFTYELIKEGGNKHGEI